MYMKLKVGSVDDPDIYLNAKLRKVTMDNGNKAGGISPSKYVHEADRNCKNYLKERFPADHELIKYAPNQFPLGCEPEMDTSPELLPNEASYFQTLIHVMRWVVELGRVDIVVEVSQRASFLVMPRQWHFINALHSMSYLRLKHNSVLVLNLSYPGVKQDEFKLGEN